MIYGTVTGHIKNITFSSAFEIERYEDVDMVHILNHNYVILCKGGLICSQVALLFTASKKNQNWLIMIYTYIFVKKML